MSPMLDTGPRPPSRRATYKRLEARREDLLATLSSMDDRVRGIPAYRTALTLLNNRFRTATLPGRVEVLEAAEFTLRVLQDLATRI